MKPSWCLLGALAFAPTACVDTVNDSAASGRNWIHRSTVSDGNGAMLSEGCAVWDNDGWAGDHWADRIHVSAVPGTLLIVEDNFGTEQVDKYLKADNLPNTDAFWCGTEGDMGREPAAVVWIECFEVVDPDPAAKLEKLEPINQRAGVTGMVAEGFVANLRVQHAGIVRLTRNPACTGADGGSAKTYGVLTIDAP